MDITKINELSIKLQSLSGCDATQPFPRNVVLNLREEITSVAQQISDMCPHISNHLLGLKDILFTETPYQGFYINLTIYGQTFEDIELAKAQISDANSLRQQSNAERSIMSNKVFIVHGHDEAAKYEVARMLEKAGFESIILHEQPDQGRTIIEKFEDYADVGFAVVLYTECDLGRAKGTPAGSEQYRARQNVVFEHGFFVATLGRDHVCALVKGEVETPGDLSGILYVKMDEAGGWKMKLAKNMKAAGLPIDMNSLV